MARKHIHIGLYSTHVRKKLVAIFQAYIYIPVELLPGCVCSPPTGWSVMHCSTCSETFSHKPLCAFTRFNHTDTCLHKSSHASIHKHAFTNLHVPSQSFTCLHKPSYAFTNFHMHSQTFASPHKPSRALTNLVPWLFEWANQVAQ